MRFNPNSGLSKPIESDGKNRRRSGRLELEILSCSIGTVLDLSGGGMRVLTRRIPRKEFMVKLIGVGESLCVPCKLAWHKRVGLFKLEVGLEFINVDPETGRKLSDLANTYRLRRVM